MGIDIGARIIVGLPYDQITSIDREALDELIDNGDIDQASPYFDAPRDDCVFGIKVADSDYRVEEFSLDDKTITEAKAAFKSKYGHEAKVYLSANVW